VTSDGLLDGREVTRVEGDDTLRCVTCRTMIYTTDCYAGPKGFVCVCCVRIEQGAPFVYHSQLLAMLRGG
jgi:hypothetical protein